jgi:transcriptional repressor NrdR
VRASGAAEVDAHSVGLAILGPLRDLDEVAYLRFASVYRGFESLADFEVEIAALRAERTLPPVPTEGGTGGRTRATTQPAHAR